MCATALTCACACYGAAMQASWPAVTCSLQGLPTQTGPSRCPRAKCVMRRTVMAHTHPAQSWQMARWQATTTQATITQATTMRPTPPPSQEQQPQQRALPAPCLPACWAPLQQLPLSCWHFESPAPRTLTWGQSTLLLGSWLALSSLAGAVLQKLGCAILYLTHSKCWHCYCCVVVAAMASVGQAAACACWLGSSVEPICRPAGGFVVCSIAHPCAHAYANYVFTPVGL